MTDAKQKSVPPRVVICRNEMRNWKEFEGSEVDRFKIVPRAYPVDHYGPTEGEDDEYISLSEHETALNEAVRNARAEAFEEAAQIDKSGSIGAYIRYTSLAKAAREEGKE